MTYDAPSLIQSSRTEGCRALIALGYLTRIPIPASVDWSEQELGRAARYFPAVGIVVGAFGAVVLVLGLSWQPAGVAVVLSMFATILLTGAFHEDGLADSADGFGGGYERSRVLAIMQDSRIGSFGAIALVLSLLLKFATLLALSETSATAACAALIIAHAASRASALPVMLWLRYAREEGDSKSKPVAQGVRMGDLAPGVAFGIAPLLAAVLFDVFSPMRILLVLAMLALACALAIRYFRRRIQGYTGDCLGAVQQVAELSVYVVLCARFA